MDGCNRIFPKILVFLSLSFCLFSQKALALIPPAQVGKTVDVEGKVSVDRPLQEQANIALTKDAPLFEGDIIKTSVQSKTTLLIGDDILSLSENATFSITAKDDGEPIFDLVAGKMRSLVGKILGAKRGTVVTDNAVIGLRGTVGHIAATPKTTFVGNPGVLLPSAPALLWYARELLEKSDECSKLSQKAPAALKDSCTTQKERLEKTVGALKEQVQKEQRQDRKSEISLTSRQDFASFSKAPAIPASQIPLMLTRIHRLQKNILVLLQQLHFQRAQRQQIWNQWQLKIDAIKAEIELLKASDIPGGEEKILRMATLQGKIELLELQQANEDEILHHQIEQREREIAEAWEAIEEIVEAIKRRRPPAKPVVFPNFLILKEGDVNIINVPAPGEQRQIIVNPGEVQFFVFQNPFFKAAFLEFVATRDAIRNINRGVACLVATPQKGQPPSAQAEGCLALLGVAQALEQFGLPYMWLNFDISLSSDLPLPPSDPYAFLAQALQGSGRSTPYGLAQFAKLDEPPVFDSLTPNTEATQEVSLVSSSPCP